MNIESIKDELRLDIELSKIKVPGFNPVKEYYSAYHGRSSFAISPEQYALLGVDVFIDSLKTLIYNELIGISIKELNKIISQVNKRNISYVDFREEFLKQFNYISHNISGKNIILSFNNTYKLESELMKSGSFYKKDSTGSVHIAEYFKYNGKSVYSTSYLSDEEVIVVPGDCFNMEVLDIKESKTGTFAPKFIIEYIFEYDSDVINRGSSYYEFKDIKKPYKDEIRW